jgi:uncharacterized membrane protein
VLVCIGFLLAVLRKSRGTDAIKMLRIRDAKGEIDRDEFDRMKQEREVDGRARTGRQPN